MLLEKLEKEKLLTDTAENIGSQYCVCVHKKGTFGKFFDKLFKEDNEKGKLALVVLKN